MKKLIIVLFFWACISIAHTQTPQTFWNVNGNAGALDSIFLGTTDCHNLIFKTKNIERMCLRADKSFLGIGTDQHTASLHLHYQADLRSCLPIIAPKVVERKLLHLTTPETGSASTKGFFISYSDQKEIKFKQQENAKFFIEGCGGGLTIAPNGKIGIGTDDPQAKLDVNGWINAHSANIAGTQIAPLQGGNGSYISTNRLNADIGTISDLTTTNFYINSHFANNGWDYASRIWVDSEHTKALAVSDGNANDLFTIFGNGHLSAQSACVKNLMCAKEVRVSNPSCWPDYVFDKDYELLPLSIVEQFIVNHQHLPNVPSAAEVEENGVNLGEMNAILLQKVEELTLYVIQLEKRLTEVENKKGGE